MVLHFSLILFEFIKSFRLVVHQVYVPVPWVIVNESDDVLISTSCTSAYWRENNWQSRAAEGSVVSRSVEDAIMGFKNFYNSYTMIRSEGYL